MFTICFHLNLSCTAAEYSIATQANITYVSRLLSCRWFRKIPVYDARKVVAGQQTARILFACLFQQQKLWRTRSCVQNSIELVKGSFEEIKSKLCWKHSFVFWLQNLKQRYKKEPTGKSIHWSVCWPTDNAQIQILNLTISQWTPPTNSFQYFNSAFDGQWSTWVEFDRSMFSDFSQSWNVQHLGLTQSIGMQYVKISV